MSSEISAVTDIFELPFTATDGTPRTTIPR